jgi:hypothetical protein
MTLEGARKEAQRRANVLGNSYIVCKSLTALDIPEEDRYMVCLTLPIHATRVGERIYPERKEV